MPKKKEMTLQDHAEMGTKLRELHNDLIKASVFLSNAMGKTKARSVTDKMAKMEKTLRGIRSQLENTAAEQYGDKVVVDRDIYF